MSDRAMEALSVVRREEESNAQAKSQDATEQQMNAELPGNNDSADQADEHQNNADNLGEVGANAGSVAESAAIATHGAYDTRPASTGPLTAQSTPSCVLVNPRARASYTDWYHSPSEESWAQPAKDAYDLAIETFTKELSQDELHSIGISSQSGISSQNSMLDVQVAVQSALNNYETRTKTSKARMWLHYPEFTSLVWGTFKFLFTAVLNHEELLAEISKAISLIADMLPWTVLHSELYPTKRMREAVARLYAKIIKFALMAVQWSKKSKVMHSVAAIIHPFKLSFSPIINEIAEHSQRVNELASAASRAEIRDQHVEIHSLKRETEIIVTRLSLQNEMIIAQQSLQGEVLIDLRDQKQFFRNAQLEDVHQLMLEQGTPDSESSLAFCRSMRTRRIQKLSTQLPAASIPTLRAWVDEPTSLLLLAESRGVRTSPLDFAVEFLNAVLEREHPLIWALPFLTESFQFNDETAAEPPSSPQSLSVAGILRSLVLQTLHLSAAAMTESRNPVTIRHLRSIVTVEQWFKVLERCVSTLPALFIVIDIGILEAAVGRRDFDDEDDARGDRECYRVSDFIDRMSEMVGCRQRQGRLKVVIAAVNFREAASMDTEEVFGDMCIHTDRGRQIGRLMRQPKYRGVFRQRNRIISEEIRTVVGKF
ncbi:Nacht domain protein [Apiospora hydei]|uniref:Nacht domain protein n=1 Tax=Apiospora hydei TaxID=1337664 RepID=A0ABR1USX4_9PEZI